MVLVKLTTKNQLTLPKEDAVQPARGWRAGWDQQFREVAERGDDQLLATPTPTDWEAKEWEW